MCLFAGLDLDLGILKVVQSSKLAQLLGQEVTSS